MARAWPASRPRHRRARGRARAPAVAVAARGSLARRERPAVVPAEGLDRLRAHDVPSPLTCARDESMHHLGVRRHALLSAIYILSHLVVDALGVPFELRLDWMWLADPSDLRNRLLETLYYYHAFPPGMNLMTAILLDVGGADATRVAHAAFWIMGLGLVNALFYVACALGLSTPVAFGVSIFFSLVPASIYFAHLYLYEWPVTTMLCLAAACFHAGVRRGSFAAWLACFGLCAAVGLTRSTFHVIWFAIVVVL